MGRSQSTGKPYWRARASRRARAPAAINHPPPERLGPQQDVVQRRVRPGQHEMLVDHADARGDGVRGRRPNALLSANEDLPGVRPQHAVEDLHGGGFARAVFPDDAMNGAGLDPQIHPRVGQHAAELLGQSAQLNCWRGIGRHDSGSVRIWRASQRSGFHRRVEPIRTQPPRARQPGSHSAGSNEPGATLSRSFSVAGARSPSPNPLPQGEGGPSAARGKDHHSMSYPHWSKRGSLSPGERVG